MKKRLTMTFIMLFIVMLTINVKADYIGAYSTIEKSEDSRLLYNSMPTDIKRGDIISVKVMLKMAKDLEEIVGYNTIFWDKDAFEIVENDDEYFTVLNSDIDVQMSFEDENRIALHYYYDGITSSDNEQIVEFKFRVKNSAKDGVYKIGEMFDSNGVSTYIGDERCYSYSSGVNLKYQIGKTKLVSIFNKDDIANGSYVIGKHLFTREGSDEYNGSLTTEYIMLASKTIESNNKDDMIVYIKNARGNWLNAISNEEITPPTNFDVEYVDMKLSYQENGIFTDSKEKTILRVIQFNDKEAIVSIEDNNVTVHGIARVNNHTVSLSINGKNYNINLSDEEAVISTNDTNITNTRLSKRTNFTVNDYYGSLFGRSDEDYNPVAYLRSNQTGKYIFGNKELYFLKVNDEYAKVCIKDKTSTECEYDEYAYRNRNGYYIVFDEAAFTVTAEEKQYGFSYEENGIKISCEGNCTDNPYVGNYTKESSLTMEDVFHLWEENYIEYKVLLDLNYDDWSEELYVRDGDVLDDYIYSDYMYNVIHDPYRENYKFVEWQLNGQKFDVDTPITGPITLVAIWEDEITTPELLVQNTNDYYVKNASIANLNDYCTNNCDAEDKSQREYSIDGYEVYIKDSESNYLLYGVLVPVESVFSIKSSFLPYEEVQIKLEPNVKLNYVIRTYILDENNNKKYSDYSNSEELSTIIPTPEIKFDSVSGSNVDYINYDNGQYIYRIYVYNSQDFIYNNDAYIVDGFELLEVKEDGGYKYVANVSVNAATEIRVNANETKKYFVKPYARNSYADLVYGPVSNTLVANEYYTVTFNTNGGSIIPNVSVMKGSYIDRPTDPQKDNSDFVEWKLNGVTYDFSTPVTANITLDAVWNERVYACYNNGDDYEWTYNPQDGWEVDETIDNEDDCHAPVVPTIASCPGCKFMYTTNDYQYGGENNPNATEVSTLTGVTSDYRTLNKNKFLGFTETQDGKIDRAYVCGIKGENPNQETPFCIEGSTGSSLATYNETLLNTLYGPYNDETELGCKQELTSIQCDGAVSAFSQLDYGDVNVNSDGVNCSVNSDYSMHCFEY